jgi:hypothetical protein
MSAIESVGSFTMPPLTGTWTDSGTRSSTWPDNLPPMSWELVGGQMVMGHGLAAGRTHQPMCRLRQALSPPGSCGSKPAPSRFMVTFNPGATMPARPAPA